MIKIKTGRNIIMSFVLLMSITFTTIVYSAYNTQLQIKGEAVLRTNQEIRITKLELAEVTNGAHETYNNKYEKDTTSIYGTLPSNSSLTYQVTITNKGTIDCIVSSITQPTNNNPNVNVTTDLKVNDLINKSSSKTFTITLKNNTSTQQIISLVNQYKFIKEDNPTITMSDLPTTHTKGNNYPVNYTYTVGNSGLKEKTCKSNISGAITNLSSLSTGTHTITCTVTANSGKTVTASKTTTVTYQSYTMTNLIQNGSFEDGTDKWIVGYNAKLESSTEYKYYGNKSIVSSPVNPSYGENYFFQSYSNTEVTSIDIKEGNKYYFQVKYLSPNSNIQILIYGQDWQSTGGMFYVSSLKSSTWKTSSLYIDRKPSNNSQVYVRLDNDNNGIDTPSYYDGVTFVNLTETFGAGNEPSKEWCDANIQYFDGTATIYK